MNAILKRFDKIIAAILLAFVMLIICYQVIALIWNTVESFVHRFATVGLAYAPQYGKDIGILFLNILLLMEIMETIKVFSHDHVIKVRIILIVCLIAISRKVLALGEQAIDPLAELALAALILSLAVGYYFVSKTPSTMAEPDNHEQS